MGAGETSWQHSSPCFNCLQVQETPALYAVCLHGPLNSPFFSGIVGLIFIWNP